MRTPDRQPGICYASTRDGTELPIVDVTHPSFSLTLNAGEQQQLVASFLERRSVFDRLPRLLRRALLRFFLRGSVLGEGIRRSEGAFMSGMDTYLLKLGPEMLARISTQPADRAIAAALPALGVRLRLQDVAEFLCDALAPALVASPEQPLLFLSIAGGPAIDTLNALILLHKQHSGILAGREISIAVLDMDEAGPAFGRAALDSLSAPGGPLQGARVGWRHVPYNWAHTAVLGSELQAAGGALTVCSSEGGLFEYGSDGEIVENLRALRSGGAIAVAGSVTRADKPVQRLLETSRAALHPRGSAAFRLLAEQAGWRVDRVVERPFSDNVLLR